MTKLQGYMQNDKSNLEIKLLKSIYQHIENGDLKSANQARSVSGSPTRTTNGTDLVFVDN